jgi:hypothetical protein
MADPCCPSARARFVVYAAVGRFNVDGVDWHSESLAEENLVPPVAPDSTEQSTYVSAERAVREVGGTIPVSHQKNAGRRGRRGPAQVDKPTGA